MEVSVKDYDSNRSPSIPSSGTRTLRRNRPEGKSFFEISFRLASTREYALLGGCSV